MSGSLHILVAALTAPAPFLLNRSTLLLCAASTTASGAAFLVSRTASSSTLTAAASSAAFSGAASATTSAPTTTTTPTLTFQFVLEVDLAVSLEVSTSTSSAVQLMTQLTRDRLQVHEVTESRPGALSGLILTAACLTKIGYRCKFGVDWSSTEPPIVEVIDGLVGILLLLELDVHVADQMVPKIVANVHLLHLSIFIFTLDKHVLEEVVVVLLHLLVRHVGQVRPVSCFGRILRIDVKILQ